MLIGVLDADLLDKGTRHPNLALMKISGHHKENGNCVELVRDYSLLDRYDKVYISKVFTRTRVPIEINLPNVECGGTGFFLEEAKDLPYDIEHHMPDYHLYDNYIADAVALGKRVTQFEDYLNYSIGFATRGCFRKCEFCINRKYDSVVRHSPIGEFFDPTRPYIYLWDDNFLGYSNWHEVLDELSATERPFQFRQGLDIRLMNQEKARYLSAVKYHGDYIFAFDFISQEQLIRKGLSYWREFSSHSTKLYVLCAFESTDIDDILSVFLRIKILMSYRCLPYIMRYEAYRSSQYYGMYVNLARWCNQPAIFKKMSFRQFCEANGPTSSTMRYLTWFLDKHRDFPKDYLDMRFDDTAMW